MENKIETRRKLMRFDWNEDWEFLSDMPYPVFLQEGLLIALQNLSIELRGIREALTEKEQS
jgi:hypothetical protein